MFSKRKKKTSNHQEPRAKLPFALSRKRNDDESFEVSQAKRTKNYILISDSEESAAESDVVDGDDDKDDQTDAVNTSFTTPETDNNGSDSDTGSVIVVDSRPVAVEEEVVDQSPKLNELINEIPIEVHQLIASFLPSDKDIIRYSKVCRKTYSSISDSVWRVLFLEKFDLVPYATPDVLKEKYQFRRRTTKLYTKFDFKEYKHLGRANKTTLLERQKNWLDMLQNLIIESDAHKGYDDNGNEVIVSRNLDYILNKVSFVPGTTQTGDMIDIIDSICKTDNNWDMYTICSVGSPSDPDTFVLLIQLCLTWISWDPRYCNKTISHFDLSQLEVYASPAQQPLFLGKWKNDLNVRWFLHAANFFKFHLKAGRGEGLLAHSYADLHQSQLPQPWLGRLKPGTQRLGSHWKGAYFYVNNDELARMREAGDDTDSGPYSDELDGGESFQDISLFFDDQKFGKQHWPKSWEKILESDPFTNAVPEPTYRHGSRRNTRSSRKDTKKPKEVPNPGVEYFYGSSHDSSSTAHFYGAVHGIPPQHGIPGFQRIIIIKFFPDENGAYDQGQTWGYEGCVLPGGRIIIGRWFDGRSDSDSNIMSGPFAFWNVDESEADTPIDGKEALKFFELMKLHGHFSYSCYFRFKR